MTNFLKPWKYESDYGGNDYSDYYVVHTVTRDSDILTRHNHDYIWNKLHNYFYNELGAVLKQDNSEINPDHLICPSFNHWACGWLEIIMVAKEAPQLLLDMANNLLSDLDNYPILDEDSYSEKVWQEMQNHWDKMHLWERVRFCSENNVSIFAARHDAIPEELDEVLMRIIEE